MRIASLGHVVLRVSDLDRAQAFYHDLLGLPISARSDEWSMVFFTLGQHHDFAVTVPSEARSSDPNQVGLDHVAFQLDGGLESLRDAKARLEAEGIQVAAMDHVVAKSIYFADPDGNGVELYINGTDAWRENPALILSEGGALEL